MSWAFNSARLLCLFERFEDSHESFAPGLEGPGSANSLGCRVMYPKGNSEMVYKFPRHPGSPAGSSPEKCFSLIRA